MCHLPIMMQHSHPGTRSASIYLVTLITIVAISTMVLVGVRLRSSSNSQSSLIEVMSESNTSLQNGIEYALQIIADDPRWKDLSISGKAFEDITIGDISYTSMVLDTDTMATPTDTSSNFIIQITATHRGVSNTAQYYFGDIPVDYLAYIQDLFATSYWQLNESAGESIANEAISGYDGDFLNPAIAGTASNEEGAQVPLFNSDNDHIEVPYEKDFKSQKGTISLWMKTPGTSVLETFGILGRLHTESGTPSLYLVLKNNALYAYVEKGGKVDFAKEAGPSDAITRNTWQHVALTWGDAGLTIYLDGVESAINAANTSYPGADKGGKGEQAMKIGAANYNLILTSPEAGFKGSLAHVVFFKDIQLDAATIADLASVIPDAASGG